MTLMTPEDLARMLKVSRGHVYRLVSKRRVPFVKLGGSVRFRRERIERWIESKEIRSVNQSLSRRLRK